MNTNLIVKKFCTENNHLKSLHKNNLNRLIFAYLNINPIRNNFEFLAKDLTSNVDLLMISERKIDNSFPKGQFLIKALGEPFRIDRNIHGGGILFYVREDNPVKLLSVEIYFRRRKWLVCCSYNPHKDNISIHLQLIKKKIGFYSTNYESIILVGGFNSEINDKCMNDFCESYNLSSLIRESTRYKNSENPSWFSPNGFQNSSVVEIALSDSHRMIVTVMKTSFQRSSQKIRHYGDYSNYDNTIFVLLCLMNYQN